MSTKNYKNTIIDKLNGLLKPIGYKRKGNIYSLSINDLTHYISLQSSMSSTAHVLKITVNIEMSSARLAGYHRVFHKRIGFYMKENRDKWWAITHTREAIDASTEIHSALLNWVLPDIELFKSTDDLIAYWKSGKSAGIGDLQRKYYLQLLGV